MISPLVERIDANTGSALLQTLLYRMSDVPHQARFSELICTDARGNRRVHLERLNSLVAC